MIIEVDLPHELVGFLERMADAAATKSTPGVLAHPALARQTRDRLVAEALRAWMPQAAVFNRDRGVLEVAPEAWR